MTRKHYIAIARIIRDTRVVAGDSDYNSIEEEIAAEKIRTEIAEGLAWCLGNENAKFDRARFLDACGINQTAEVSR